MARRKTTLVGLEIEPAAVHAAAVNVNGTITVKQAAVAPLEAGVIRDGEIHDPEALTQALRAMFADKKGLDRRVRVGVANQKIVVRVLEMPPVESAKELEAAVRFSAQDHIPMPLDQALIDFQPLDVVETEAGRRQRVLIVAARRDMIERVLEVCRAAGLKPEGVDLSAFAMIRALGHRAPESGPVLYLAVGGITNLAVAEGHSCLFTRVVGGGIEAIAAVLAERQGLTLEHARDWLRHVGLSEPIDQIASGDHDEIVADARAVLQDGVRRIGGEVRNSLDFHHAQGGMSLRVERAILTGAAGTIPGFAEALATELNMPVELGVVEGATGGFDPHLLTVAAGLAVEEVTQS